MELNEISILGKMKGDNFENRAFQLSHIKKTSSMCEEISKILLTKEIQFRDCLFFKNNLIENGERAEK